MLNEVSPQIDRRDLPGLLDEDGFAHGFVELFNGGESSVPLAGWSLQANLGAAGSWTLPAVALPPGEVLRIWTSGKNRNDPTQPLHTDFMLRGAQVLSLQDEQAVLVDEVPLAVPVDHSYGRCGDNWYYFDVPTPGDLNAAMAQVPIVTLEPRLSLTAGRTHQLVALPLPDAIWSSTSPDLSVLSNGEIIAPFDATPGQAASWVEAWSSAAGAATDLPVTIVSWTANVSSLQALPTPDAEKVLGADDQGVYFSRGTQLHRSSDGMMTDALIGALPASPGSNSQLRATPFGFIYRTNASIYHSLDLLSWTHAFTAAESGLRSGFAVHWDEAGQTGTVVLASYSIDSGQRHAVYRGQFEPTGASSWQTAIEFSSIVEGQADPTLEDVARHVHVSSIDPYTGDAWVGTGDSSLHSRILVDGPGGAGFEVLGMGDQAWRTLAVWFSATHAYWNMDTTSNQSVWRVPRSMRHPVTGWPSITPELASGTTKAGVEYLVVADDSGTRFPASIGGTWTETSPRPLDSAHRVRALDDSAFDYRERVADLEGGSHWFQMWVTDDSGDPISIMATAAEGSWRDDLGRVFGFKEGPDGQIDVQELWTIAASPVASPFVQLEPLAQDPAGYLYFAGRKTAESLYQMRLEWNDDDGAPTGGPSSAANAIVPPVPEYCLVSVPEPAVSLGFISGFSLLSALARRRAHRAAPARAPRSDHEALECRGAVGGPSVPDTPAASQTGGELLLGACSQPLLARRAATRSRVRVLRLGSAGNGRGGPPNEA